MKAQRAAYEGIGKSNLVLILQMMQLRRAFCVNLMEGESIFSVAHAEFKRQL